MPANRDDTKKFLVALAGGTAIVLVLALAFWAVALGGYVYIVNHWH